MVCRTARHFPPRRRRYGNGASHSPAASTDAYIDVRPVGSFRLFQGAPQPPATCCSAGACATTGNAAAVLSSLCSSSRQQPVQHPFAHARRCLRVRYEGLVAQELAGQGSRGPALDARTRRCCSCIEAYSWLQAHGECSRISLCAQHRRRRAGIGCCILTAPMPDGALEPRTRPSFHHSILALLHGCSPWRTRPAASPLSCCL